EFGTNGSRRQTVPVALSEPRFDVAAAFAGAPDRCGFDLQIPCDTRIESATVAFSFLRAGQPIASEEVPMRDFGNPDALVDERALDPALRPKLRNLLLNESERLDGIVEKRS